MRHRVVEPLGFAEILEEALGLTRRHLGLVLALDLSFVPLFLVSNFLNPTNPNEAVTLAVALGLLGLALQTVGATATTYAMGGVYLGEDVTLGDAFGRGISRALPLFVTQLLGGLLALVGFLLFILPGVYLSLAFLLVSPVVVVESVAGSKALSRSRVLMRGHLFRGAALLAVSMVVFLLAGTAGIFLSSLAPPLAEVIEVALNAIVAGYFTTVVTIFYFDLRCRKEGYSGAVAAADAVPSRPDPIG